MLVVSLQKIEPLTLDLLEKIKERFVLELRLDLIDFEDIKSFRKEFSGEILLTVKKDFLKSGNLSDLFLLRPSYIDLEYDAPLSFFEKIKKETSIKIISSFHDCENFPDLENVFFKMQNPHVDIYKIACFASSSLHSFLMLKFVKEKIGLGYNICGICMGEKGTISRILSPLVGSFTYCHINGQTALGQLSYEVLEKRYRYSSLNKDTSIYALIGGDVSKSVADVVHNKILAMASKNSVYVKISLTKDELGSFFENIRAFPIQGISVTTPFKEEVGKFLKESKENLPINTLVKKNESYLGYNTDGAGVVIALEKRMRLKDKVIIVLGAGGAAKAIAFAIKKRGGRVIILNRTKEKALLLAKELKCQAGAINEMEFYEKYDAIINATSVEDPADEKCFLPYAIAFDVHTRPQITNFLKKAMNKNCRPIYGFEMFIYQAKEQYRLWNHQELNISPGEENYIF